MIPIRIDQIIEQTKEALSHWRRLATEWGCQAQYESDRTDFKRQVTDHGCEDLRKRVAVQ